jgi:hypothetical protein
MIQITHSRVTEIHSGTIFTEACMEHPLNGDLMRHEDASSLFVSVARTMDLNQPPGIIYQHWY